MEQNTYAVDQAYSDARLGDVYNSEEYHELLNITLAISKALDTFVVKYPQYDNIRTIDVTKLRIGDLAQYNVDKRVGQITMINDVTAKMKLEADGKIIEIPKYSLEPHGNPTLRLKGPDIRCLYSGIREICRSECSDAIKYFSSFSDYFKISPTILWQCLGDEVRLDLLALLNERTGALNMEGVRNMPSQSIF